MEALAQAYRVWTPSVVPYDIAELLKEPAAVNVSSNVCLMFGSR